MSVSERVCECERESVLVGPQVLLTLNTLALNMVSVVHNALKIFDSIQRQLMGPDYAGTQVHTHTQYTHTHTHTCMHTHSLLWALKS